MWYAFIIYKLYCTNYILKTVVSYVKIYRNIGIFNNLIILARLCCASATLLITLRDIATATTGNVVAGTTESPLLCVTQIRKII